MKPTIVLAASKVWNPLTKENLAQKTGYQVLEINQQSELNLEFLAANQPKYIFFSHWSYLIPKEIYQNYECVIFHMTDLPYGRGGSPLQNLILRGHTTTKISALKCVAELDAGPIYLKKPLDLAGSAQEIFEKAAEIIEKMIIEILQTNPQPIEQQIEANAKQEIVKFTRRQPAQSNLNTAKINELTDIYDFIRMLDAEGYPQAFLEIAGYKIEFSKAEMEASTDKITGKFTIQKIEQ